MLHNGYRPNRFRRLAAGGKAISLLGKGEERPDHLLIDNISKLAARVIYRRSYSDERRYELLSTW